MAGIRRDLLRPRKMVATVRMFEPRADAISHTEALMTQDRTVSRV
jgi:hypothetical protein